MDTIITSRKNPSVMLASSLKDKKNRDKYRLFCAEGSVLLKEALASGITPREVYFTKRAASLLPPGLECQTREVAESVYEKMSSEDSPEGILSVFSYLDTKEPDSASYTAVVLEGIQDPGNAGTVIRTAAALGISEVILTGCADIYNQKTVRASMGAVFRTPVRVFGTAEECAAYLKRRSCPVAAAVVTPSASRLSRKADLPYRAIMIGNEGHGLTEKAKSLCDGEIYIPMKSMESLNAAVAAGIFMWELAGGTDAEK